MLHTNTTSINGRAVPAQNEVRNIRMDEALVDLD